MLQKLIVWLYVSVFNAITLMLDIIIYFEVDCVISSVTNAIMNPDMIVGYVSVVLVYITIMVLLIRNNIRVNEKDYV